MIRDANLVAVFLATAFTLAIDGASFAITIKRSLGAAGAAPVFTIPA
jgi:hypothetical protein